MSRSRNLPWNPTALGWTEKHVCLPCVITEIILQVYVDIRTFPSSPYCPSRANTDPDAPQFSFDSRGTSRFWLMPPLFTRYISRPRGMLSKYQLIATKWRQSVSLNDPRTIQLIHSTRELVPWSDSSHLSEMNDKSALSRWSNCLRPRPLCVTYEMAKCAYAFGNMLFIKFCIIFTLDIHVGKLYVKIKKWKLVRI